MVNTSRFFISRLGQKEKGAYREQIVFEERTPEKTLTHINTCACTEDSYTGAGCVVIRNDIGNPCTCLNHFVTSRHQGGQTPCRTIISTLSGPDLIFTSKSYKRKNENKFPCTSLLVKRRRNRHNRTKTKEHPRVTKRYKSLRKL